MKNKIQKLEIFGAEKNNYPVSVIIVSFRGNELLIKCLNSLKKQSYDFFELILIDNGGNDRVYNGIKNYRLKYIKLKKNHKPSEARNIALWHAASPIVCFLDDDALADENFVQGHFEAHKDKKIIGVRGKILPKTKVIYNYLCEHYDLGEEIIGSYIDVEGNSSFKKEFLINAGGFNPDFFGSEGLELSYRLVNKYGAKLVYCPKAVIYHDYSAGLIDFLEKELRHNKMRERLRQESPDIFNFAAGYNLPKKEPFEQRIKKLALFRRIELKILHNLSVYLRN